MTETVLILTLHHKTAEEMREEYHFNARQDEYLTLLSAENAAPLWADLLGGFGMGELGGEILSPGSDTTLADGALQWPLPVAGTITSPQGYRTDPITGETSYHSGTDIAVPEGTPDPGRRRRHRHRRQRPRQLGWQLWLLRQARPRRQVDHAVRPLLEHLRDRRPAGQNR